MFMKTEGLFVPETDMRVQRNRNSAFLQKKKCNHMYHIIMLTWLPCQRMQHNRSDKSEGRKNGCKTHLIEQKCTYAWTFFKQENLSYINTPIKLKLSSSWSLPDFLLGSFSEKTKALTAKWVSWRTWHRLGQTKSLLSS